MAKSISWGAAAAAAVGVPALADAAPSPASADTAMAQRSASRRETGRDRRRLLVPDESCIA
jgi:hypothetical protein